MRTPSFRLAALALSLLSLNGAARAQSVDAALCNASVPVDFGEAVADSVSPRRDMARPMATLSVGGTNTAALASELPPLSVSGNAEVVSNPGEVLLAGPSSISLLSDCVAVVHGAPLVSQSMSDARDTLARRSLRWQRIKRLGTPGSGPLAVYIEADARARDDANNGAVKIDTTGLTVGADYRLNERWVVGGTLGLTRPRARWIGTGSNVKGETTQLSGYASWSPISQAYVSATTSLETANYGIHTDLGTGFFTDAIAHGHSWGLSLAAGYDVALGSVSLSPYARLDQVRSHIGGFTDSSITTKGRSSAIAAGLQANTTLPQSWGVLVPYARVELTQITHWRITGDSAQAYVSATGALPVPHPIEVDRNYGQFGLGLSGVLQRGLSVFADYDQGFGIEGVSQWRFNLGLRSEL
jgi:uncharacterized protein YhjY with autotransporter beta-barrel domain